MEKLQDRTGTLIAPGAKPRIRLGGPGMPATLKKLAGSVQPPAQGQGDPQPAPPKAPEPKAEPAASPVSEPSSKAADNDKQLLDTEEELFFSRLEMFNNTERRKRLEERLAPLSMDMLSNRGEFYQDVTTDRMVLAYRTPSGGEIDAINKRVSLLGIGGFYILNHRLNCLACCSLNSINGHKLPNHIKDGEFDSELFEARLKAFFKYPGQVVEDAAVQYLWFDERVATFLAGGALGNG